MREREGEGERERERRWEKEGETRVSVFSTCEKGTKILFEKTQKIQKVKSHFLQSKQNV